jgi:hypothetical protein
MGRARNFDVARVINIVNIGGTTEHRKGQPTSGRRGSLGPDDCMNEGGRLLNDI